MDVDRFINHEEAVEFFCVVCQAIAYQPVKHRHCNRIYCYECLHSMAKQTTKCPRCFSSEEIVIKKDIQQLDEEIQIMYNQLVIKCMFCEKLLKMIEYPTHSQKCPKWPGELKLKTRTMIFQHQLPLQSITRYE